MNRDSYLIEPPPREPRHPTVAPVDLRAGIHELIEEYTILCNVLRLRIPVRFPVGCRVRFPASYAGPKSCTGRISGYASNEPAAVRVLVDEQPGQMPLTVFVWAYHLTLLQEEE